MHSNRCCLQKVSRDVLFLDIGADREQRHLDKSQEAKKVLHDIFTIKKTQKKPTQFADIIMSFKKLPHKYAKSPCKKIYTAFLFVFVS